MFKYTDLPAFAATRYQGDRTAAVEALIRSGPNVKYVPNNAYADAKLVVAWWTAALARRLPSGMAVYAVSPGGATTTNVVRSAGWALRHIFIPIVNLIPGMNRPPEIAASRYLQASEFATDVSGQFFASAQGKSQARLRCSATHTSTTAPARKRRGRPSSRSPASTTRRTDPSRRRVRRYQIGPSDWRRTFRWSQSAGDGAVAGSSTGPNGILKHSVQKTLTVIVASIIVLNSSQLAGRPWRHLGEHG